MLSEQIKEVLDFLNSANQEYNRFYGEVNRLDRMTQDYLHELELGDTNNRRRTATALANCRKARRANLDQAETYAHLAAVLQTESSRRFIKTLSEVLGITRKEEEKHQNRLYRVKEAAAGELTLKTFGGK